MAFTKLEYIWLDGYETPNLRSKVKVIPYDLSLQASDVTKVPDLCCVPEWTFDGSSTNQADGHKSDCVLKPVKVFYSEKESNDIASKFYVLCEVYSSNGQPHPSNTRAALARKAGAADPEHLWFGFEQEYVFLGKSGNPLGFPENGYPRPQGEYYCGVGASNAYGRAIVEEHLDTCLRLGINLTGTNAEVLVGQWEYQCFGKGALEATDTMIMSRYLLHKIAEKYGVSVTMHPKPITTGDFNGSGMHSNFSTKRMRETGGKELFRDICEEFKLHHAEHIAVYGKDNTLRLTGKHETQSIDKFSYGISDRGASIRVPLNVTDTWRGYLEDRRPAANADPYQVASMIFDRVEKFR